jgi:hypothetical protein
VRRETCFHHAPTVLAANSIRMLDLATVPTLRCSVRASTSAARPEGSLGVDAAAFRARREARTARHGPSSPRARRRKGHARGRTGATCRAHVAASTRSSACSGVGVWGALVAVGRVGAGAIRPGCARLALAALSGAPRWADTDGGSLQIVEDSKSSRD